MTQAEIIECLENAQKEKRKALSRTEIADRINLDPSLVSHILAVLVKHEEVKCVEIDRYQAKVLFGRTGRMMLYYL